MAQTPANDFERRVEQRLADLDAPELPGYAYAVIEDGEIVHSGEHGLIELGGKALVRSDTAFPIGSISKSFTALAIMQLVEAGEVDLDAPASRYLERFADTPAARVTIRQLLSHTSGFSTVQGNLTQSNFSMAPDALEQRVDGLTSLAPAAAPGTVWQYSNANYQILGRIIETVSGESFSDYITSRILDPLEMDHSFVHRVPSPPRTATGHLPWFGGYRSRESNLLGRGSAPQGGIVASTQDMARYLAMMMNGEDDLVSPEAKALMMQPAGDVARRYGLGWEINPDLDIVFHGGLNPGFHALAAMRPEERRGVVVLTNAASGFAYGSTDETRFGIASVALDLPYEKPDRTLPRVLWWTFIALIAVFLIGIGIAWRARNKPRKGGIRSAILLWVPPLAGGALALALVFLLPRAFGGTFGSAMTFFPDIALVIGAVAVLALVWALAHIVSGLVRPGPA